MGLDKEVILERKEKLIEDLETTREKQQDIEKMKLEMKHDCDKALNILNKYKI